MSFFNDMVKNIKQIVVPEDDDIFVDDDMFDQEPSNSGFKLPSFARKEKNSKKNPEFLSDNQGIDLNSFDLNNIKNENANKNMKNRGHIQVYVPKNYEQSFEIIKNVKDGITAMVNVEVCPPQISQRIVDVISGAVFALGGQCKKMGEKQYIFSMNAEMSGAYDYLPGQGITNQGYQSGFNQQNPFSFMDYQQQPINQGFQNNQMFNQPMNQQPFQNQNGFGFQNNNLNPQNINPNINQNMQNNNNSQVNFDFKDYYIPPQNQF